MVLRLPSGVPVEAAQKPPPRGAPTDYDAEVFPGRDPVIVRRSGGTQSSWPSEVAAVRELRALAKRALASKRRADKIAAWVERNRDRVETEHVASLIDARSTYEASCSLAGRLWAALPGTAQAVLVGEGWPAPGTGWEAARNRLQEQIGRGEIPGPECPF